MNDILKKLFGLLDLCTLVESYNLKIVLLLTIGFAAASILGYFAWRIKLSPILGYLIAGFLIGPYSPGFVADVKTSEQLAEIGVILMMFGVGLDFRLQNLMRGQKNCHSRRSWSNTHCCNSGCSCDLSVWVVTTDGYCIATLPSALQVQLYWLGYSKKTIY